MHLFGKFKKKSNERLIVTVIWLMHLNIISQTQFVFAFCCSFYQYCHRYFLSMIFLTSRPIFRKKEIL